MRISTSPRAKKPPLTKAGDTAEICPDTSDTNVVWVRGDTSPRDLTTNSTGSRLAVATDTSNAGLGTASFGASGRVWIMANDARTAATMNATGRMIFRMRVMGVGLRSPGEGRDRAGNNSGKARLKSASFRRSPNRCDGPKKPIEP